MKYNPISNTLFIENRKHFSALMKPHSLAVFNSNDIYPISSDSAIPFEQHRDIFYLSGINQEQSILVIFPDCKKEKHREILFMRETNDHIAVWEGAKLSKDDAFNVSGIKTVYWLQDMEKIMMELMAEAETVYLNTNEYHKANLEVETREYRYIKWLKNKYPAHQVAKSAPILKQLRSIKHPIEIDLIKEACNITEKGFRRLLKFVKPGVWEYEVEAELIHEFIKNRANKFAYQPIIASGNNSNVLHYIENNKQCKAGDLLLLDVAAEYANYASDMTRTIPVSGKFTPRQKAVYNAVNRVKIAATKMLVPGTDLDAYQDEVCKLMESELLGLKLIDKTDIKNQDPNWPAFKKYFMHGTSHHLGLDTHDYGVYDAPIKANMVFTVEPAIYIPEEGFGIRLEDNVWVQAKGEPINLMGTIPIDADEIEDLMHSK